MQQCFGKSKVEVCFEEGVGNFRGSTPQKCLGSCFVGFGVWREGSGALKSFWGTEKFS